MRSNLKRKNFKIKKLSRKNIFNANYITIRAKKLLFDVDPHSEYLKFIITVHTSYFH